MNIRELLDSSNNLIVIGQTYKQFVHKIHLPNDLLEEVEEEVRELNIVNPRDLVYFFEESYPFHIDLRVQEVGPADYLSPNIELHHAFDQLRMEAQMASNRQRLIWSFKYFQG
jgi:hypothetical protein